MPPGWTLLSAVKLALRTELVNVNPDPLSRLSKATSEGELTRVGTCEVEKVGGPDVRATLESFGKTRYISTTRSEMLGVPVPPTKRPTKDAEVMSVCDPSTKSSPASISKELPTSGRAATAIRVFGFRLL